MTNEEAIAANVGLVQQAFPEQNLLLDEPSVEWLDGYIERNRTEWDEATRNKLGNIFGSFLGEAIRSNFGGRWEMTDHGLAISFDDGNAVFPFNKVNKFIAGGEGDSISSFFSTTGVLRSIQDAE